jgi:hypothetical protein
MGAAYFCQAVNLLVGVLMVPTLLKFFDPGQFVLWAIFTTWGGLTLQIESSIQIVSGRRIAREFHGGRPLAHTLGGVRLAYRKLAAMTLGPVALAGFLYLSYVAAPRLSTHWAFEWLIFVAAYGVNYWFGVNNAVLLATDHVETYSYIAAFTRLVNFVGTLWSLSVGFGVLGVCICFASSVALNCALMALAARRALETNLPPASVSAAEAGSSSAAGGIVLYTTYTVAAYALYKIGVLTATSFFDKEVVGAYSLTLQAYTMLSSIALVPVQARLSRLVKALLAERQQDVVRELTFTLVTANAVFALGTAVLLWIGGDMLDRIGARVSLPPPIELISVGLAFVIELNLFIFINLLVTQQQFRFVKVYVSCVAVALLLAATAVAAGQPLVRSLVILPVLVQVFVCLPAVIWLVSAQMGVSPRSFAKALLQHLKWSRQ